MPNKEKKTFTHKEIAETLIERAGIQNGHWGLFIEFGLNAVNIPVGDPSGELSLKPAAMVAINTIGIQQFDEPNPLTVDAATVKRKRTASRSGGNPKKGTAK